MKLTAEIEGKTVEIEVGNLFPEFCSVYCKGNQEKIDYCKIFKTKLEGYRQIPISQGGASLRCQDCIKIFGGVE